MASFTGWVNAQPVSAESRFNRIYPQATRPQAASVTTDTVAFIWRVQTEFPFYVASGSRVYIRSAMTETLP